MDSSKIGPDSSVLDFKRALPKPPAPRSRYDQRFRRSWTARQAEAVLDSRVRMTVSRGGRVRVVAQSLVKGESIGDAVAVDPVDTSSPFLFHKTTRREVYDDRRARHRCAGNVLVVNDRASDEESDFDFLYPLNQNIEEKISTIATEIYGASGIELSAKAKKQIAGYEENGFGYLPICMAKTHLSMSHDPSLKGAPTGYVMPVREVRASIGAGFIYPIIGTMRTMPGLGTKPAFMNVDVDEKGNVVGVF